MTQFLYQAKQGPYKTVQGILEAEGIEMAIRKVVSMDLTPITVQIHSQAKIRIMPQKIAFNFQRKVSYADTVFFIRQISDLINADVPVLKALSLCSRQSKNPVLHNAISQMIDHVRDGGTLSNAMARCPEVFTKLYSNLVKSGEQSGRLAEVLNRLADLVEKDQESRAQVVSSMIYPALILIVGSATIFALLTWVVPRLTSIFTDLNEALPVSTAILLAISGFMSRFWILILGLFAAIGFYFKQMLDQESGRLWFDRFKLRLPVIGSLIRCVETGRFARTLATLLANGVPVIPALNSTALVINNIIMKKQITNIAQAVKDGSSLNNALKNCSEFPQTVVTMVAVGEASGKVHHGLERMADYFEKQVQRYVKTITTLIEPVLILILGLVVGFVVLAMLMPLLRMNMIIH